MRIEKGEHSITSVDDWHNLAPPKSNHHWTEERSAFELARAWCGAGNPAMPADLRRLLDSRPETQGLLVECVTPEHRIRFDANGGEPRNADLAFVGRVGASSVAVTIEAKADETFGATVAETVVQALERAIQNPRSRGSKRVQELVQSLLHPWHRGLPNVGGLRYQLLTGVAGTLAYALEQRASTAVFVVHEFVTDKTKDELHARNVGDYRAFLHRLRGSSPTDTDSSAMLGPFAIPGAPLFSQAPTLLIGKVVTNRRGASQARQAAYN